MTGTIGVRDATADDADAIGYVHVAAWKAVYRGLLPASFLESLDPAARARARCSDAEAAGWRLEVLDLPEGGKPGALIAGDAVPSRDHLLAAQVLPDAYDTEVERDVIDIDTPINVGFNYEFPSGSNLKAFVIGGTTIGAQYSYVFNPARRLSPGGLEEAPLPIPPSDQAVIRAWGLDKPATEREAETLLKALLEDEGIRLDGFTTVGNTATVRIQNTRFDIEAQSIGRTARVMANVLPPSVTTFTIISQPRGAPNSSVTLQRADLEEFQTDFDGPWRSLSRARIEDAPSTSPREGELEGTYPTFSYALAPYTAFSFFDPDEPIRLDVGPELSVGFTPSPGLSFNGVFRYPIYSTIDDATRRSDSVLPRVRSDNVLYAIESDLEINTLTAEYIFRPGPDLFARGTVGYLESMFAGVSGELLWYPIDSDLAFGVELNYAVQRDFDILFGLQDYDVFTGHASAYYDAGGGFIVQVDAGRYLAGDWGATFGLDRVFNNGFQVGAFFTLTDVTSDEFGEGSFDKGIRLLIPVSWLTGEPSRGAVAQVIRPVLRDGGARLQVANRLYGLTRDYRADNLSDGWGRVFR